MAGLSTSGQGQLRDRTVRLPGRHLAARNPRLHPVQVQVRDKRLEAKDQPGTPIIAAGEFVLGYSGEGGSYPDVRRSRLPEWMRDGSFQVFLRLRQDVDGWQAKMDELSPLSTPDDAAAAAIGRALDGKPLAAPGQGGISTTLRSRRTNWGNRPRGSHICAR